MSEKGQTQEKFAVKWAVVRDRHNESWSVVAEELSDTIQVCGMQDKDGKTVYFESEFYRLRSWCAEHKLLYAEGVHEFAVVPTFEEPH